MLRSHFQTKERKMVSMAENQNDCIFCKIAAHEIPTTIEYEDEHLLVFKDINPQAPVHFLVIPKKHISRVGDIGEEDLEVVGRLVQAANRVAKDMGIFEEGY